MVPSGELECRLFDRGPKTSGPFCKSFLRCVLTLLNTEREIGTFINFGVSVNRLLNNRVLNVSYIM